MKDLIFMDSQSSLVVKWGVFQFFVLTAKVTRSLQILLWMYHSRKVSYAAAIYSAYHGESVMMGYPSLHHYSCTHAGSENVAI